MAHGVTAGQILVRDWKVAAITFDCTASTKSFVERLVLERNLLRERRSEFEMIRAKEQCFAVLACVLGETVRTVAFTSCCTKLSVSIAGIDSHDGSMKLAQRKAKSFPVHFSDQLTFASFGLIFPSLITKEATNVASRTSSHYVFDRRMFE